MTELLGMALPQYVWVLVVDLLGFGGWIAAVCEGVRVIVGRLNACYNFLVATHFTWGMLVNHFSEMGDEELTLQVWQCPQLRTGSWGGDVQLTLTVRYNISCGRGSACISENTSCH